MQKALHIPKFWCQAKYVTDQIHDVGAIVHAHKSLSFPPYVFWGLEFGVQMYMLCTKGYLYNAVHFITFAVRSHLQ